MESFRAPVRCVFCSGTDLISVPASDPDLIAWQCQKCGKLQFRQRKNIEDSEYRRHKMYDDLKVLKRYALIILIFNLYACIKFLIFGWQPIYTLGFFEAVSNYNEYFLFFIAIMAGFALALITYLYLKKWLE